MKPSDYFAIEAAITQRVKALWVSPLQSIAELVYAEKYDDAIELALSIDLSVLKIKDYVIAVLKSAAAYGAMLAESTPHFLNDPIFGQVADHFMESLEHTTSVAIQDSVIDAINAVKNDPTLLDPPEGVVKKALSKDRFVKEFTSYADGTDQHLRLIASLHTHRLSTWGFTAEAMLVKAETYRLVAVLDNRTSHYCRHVAHGKEFRVIDARQKILEVLGSPMEAVKSIHPWPKQTKAALEAYKAMTSDEMTALGLHIGPFHPECRTMCVLASSKLILPSPTASTVTYLPEIPKNQAPIPVTAQDFTTASALELGLKMTAKAVKAWGDNLKTDPAETLAALTGRTATEVVEGGLKLVPQKHRVGTGKSLTLQFEETYPSTAANPPVVAFSVNVNAIDSTLKLNYLEVINHATPYKVIASRLGGALRVAEANKLSYLTMSVEGDMAWLASVFGFQTSNIITLRRVLNANLDSMVNLNPTVLPQPDLDAIRTMINSPKLGTVGMQALAKYPAKVGAKPVGMLLFQGVKMDARFDLSDPALLALLISYLGGV